MGDEVVIDFENVVHRESADREVTKESNISASQITSEAETEDSKASGGEVKDSTDDSLSSSVESKVNEEQNLTNGDSTLQISQDPQADTNTTQTEIGAATEITQILVSDSAVETAQATLGIDVSKYQGTIRWDEVAAAGIEFAMIRVGYRTTGSGEIIEDSNARYNLQEATKNGIKAGVYFYSTAISEAEAIEEAQWVKKLIAGYKITYPVAYDCEGYENVNSRQYGIGREERTALAKAFLNEIYAGGYTPMFYSSKGEMTADNKWLTSELEKNYKIWLSWYPAQAFPTTPKADYAGKHAMWQYTNNGTIAGIVTPVDVNVAYFGYEGEANAQEAMAPADAKADVEALMNFKEVTELVTAKETTNLRNMPSQGTESQVMLQLSFGEAATRTGISDSGWSRVVYNGVTYYAVSSLLTTDLTGAGVTATTEDDGIETVFTPVNDMVTPKIEVNLRTLPSVTNADSKVVATIKAGEFVNRTGVNLDVGWSRVEYNGQILYCVTSYVEVAQ
ncbi:MAG: glycoside hydrolase family 25 [Lachnospiraceae bacterium]|nr:glycoside hydrolase family 25 [Lachnospiraceae bacterium]